MSKLPVVTELPIDSRTGMFSLPWRQWLQTIDRALGDAGTDTAALAAQVAAIATALGSPDGTVANIPDQDSLDFVIVNGNGISITGTPASGRVTVSLAMQELAPNLVYASPASGADDVPTFRALVNADLPDMANKTIKARKTAGTGDPEDCTASEVLDFVPGTPTKGDLIVRDTSASARIAAGTNGHVLTSNGPGALPTYQAPSGGGSGAMTLVGTATVAGAAATTLTMSSLDLAADGEYVIEFAAANATASVATISVYFNGDTTASNYWRQTTTANSGISGSRASDAAMFSMLASGYATGKMCAFTGRDGRANLMLDYNRSGAGSILTQHQGMEYQTVANVTSIALSSSVANSLAVGTYFKVWKVN